MGNWNITITGIGCHHNKDYPNDVDRMAADFVKRLIAAGHVVSHASFTHGGVEDLSANSAGPCGTCGVQHRPHCDEQYSETD